MNRSLPILAAIIAPLPFLAGLVFAGTANAANPLVAVPGNVNPAISHSAKAGELAANTPMSVAVSLKLRDEAGLRKFLSDVSNPRSPQYRHFLTPAQFTARFGPTRAEVTSVTSFLAAHGLTVKPVRANSQVVDATGTAGQIEQTFSTRLGLYQQAGKSFYANETAPNLPAAVANAVSGVAGLDNHGIRKAHNVKQTARPRTAGGYGPSDLTSAYSVNGLGDGSGVSVALWEFDGYQSSNISAYDSNYGLNSPTPSTVSVDGANYDSSPGGGQGEVELDIEVVNAMAPAAATYVYEAPNSDAGQIDMAAQIASEDKVSVTSISWGQCETQSSSSTLSSTDNALAQGTAEGISFYSASGDSGSDDCGDGTTAVDYPASSPDVVGTGGTTLNGPGSETAWNGSGGGVSAVYSNRNVPDVSADADPNTGYAIYSAGAWQVYGGTSCAAPLWSGITALFDGHSGKKLGNPDAAYASIGNGSSYSSAFNDITSGSNGSFSAGPGYDNVTGWGSPIASGLYTALGL
ncbi:MAG TPA: S53 family peptidase [Pseudonocardiaceae bacterium]|nr:S53 family peptidase [Pseudonocardiaceae bacterium]